jgi:hypothetical protein
MKRYRATLAVVVFVFRDGVYWYRARKHVTMLGQRMTSEEKIVENQFTLSYGYFCSRSHNQTFFFSFHLRDFIYGIMPTGLRGRKTWGSWP